MRARIAVLVMLAAACKTPGGAPAVSNTQPGEAFGIYDFEASLPTATMNRPGFGLKASGRFSIDPDTSILLGSGGCGTIKATSTELRLACPPVQSAHSLGIPTAFLTFDPRNPTVGARWEATIPVRRQREVCERYEVRSGREVCTARKIETYETSERRFGAVTVRRVN